jgi:hypothetical protein
MSCGRETERTSRAFEFCLATVRLVTPSLPQRSECALKQKRSRQQRPKISTAPQINSAGPPVVCLGLAEGAKAFLRIQLRQDLMAHALSLSHLTFVTTIRIFHFFKDRPPFPCMPIIISSGGKLNMESAGSTNLVGPWWYLKNHFPPFEGVFDTSRFRCQVVEKQRRKALDFATASPRTQRSDGNHGSAKHAHEAKRHAKTSVCGVC